MQAKTIVVKIILFWKMEDDLHFIEKGRRPEKNNATKNN
jgi:hypothetical protein